MKNRKKLLKTLKFAVFIPFLIMVSVTFAFFVSFWAITKNDTFDAKKLSASNMPELLIRDNTGQIIETSTNMTCLPFDYTKLSGQTKNAFISIEDKTFYSHNGINLKRMAGAFLSNLKNKKIVQGGSTISQQLIKNTHLNSDKTIKRKLKEIKLTLDLEKSFSKDQILNAYLSNIYFGNGAYGIESASKVYFNKSSKDLNLAESAMLAGIINAPSSYNPLTNYEKAKLRQEIVLKEMYKDKKITESEYHTAKNQTLNIVGTNINILNQYTNACIMEACELLNLSQNQIKNKKYTLHTYLNKQVQNNITTTLQNNLKNIYADASCLVANTNGEIIAFCGNTSTDLYHLKRQPGSCIKPILVYAPAFEFNNLTLATQILDEPINLDGYSPENANKSYKGNVSVRDAIKKSLNIPAVKVLNSTGIEKSKNLASKMGIPFDSQDNNLSLALGGFTNGITIKELAESYSCLARGGVHSSLKFIDKITDENNNTIYYNSKNSDRVLSSETAYLVTDMLKSVAKSGTASRLSSLSFDVASKTGTVGTINSSNNTDAINASYTSDNIVVCWVSAKDSKHLLNKTINGSTYPTNVSKNTLEYLASLRTPANFTRPASIINANYETDENGKLYLASSNDYQTEIFKSGTQPTEQKSGLGKLNFQINNFSDSKPTLMFDTKNNIIYKVYRDNNLIALLVGRDDRISYTDFSAKKDNIYNYSVVQEYNGESNKSSEIKILCLI